MSETTARRKPGVALHEQLNLMEARAKAQLEKVAAKRQQVRDKTTGKDRARGYVQKWLEALTAKELAYEVHKWGGVYADYEDMSDAITFVRGRMFAERELVVLADEEALPEQEEEDTEQVILVTENGTVLGYT